MDQSLSSALTKELGNGVASSWFHPHASTANMKMGTSNELLVFVALLTMACFVELWEVGLWRVLAMPWLAVSPDGLAWVKLVGDIAAILSAIEVKTKTNEAAESAALHALIMAEKIMKPFCYVACILVSGEEINVPVFKVKIPEVGALERKDLTDEAQKQMRDLWFCLVPDNDHRGQIQHQLGVLHVIRCMYIVAAMGGRPMYIVVAERTQEQNDKYINKINEKAAPICEWAHVKRFNTDGTLDKEETIKAAGEALELVDGLDLLTKRLFISNFPMWLAVQESIREYKNRGERPPAIHSMRSLLQVRTPPPPPRIECLSTGPVV